MRLTCMRPPARAHLYIGEQVSALVTTAKPLKNPQRVLQAAASLCRAQHRRFASGQPGHPEVCRQEAQGVLLQPRARALCDAASWQVLLEYKVDPSLLSGICVNIGDKYIDLSAGVAPPHRLHRARQLRFVTLCRSEPHFPSQARAGTARLGLVTSLPPL
jgi:hypothetical protein